MTDQVRNWDVQRNDQRLWGKLPCFLADTECMDNIRNEQRSVVMIRVEAMWEDETRTPCVAAATIEVRSRGGLSVRIGVPIIVGSKLTIKSHRENFSGEVSNFCADDWGYVAGIKPDTAANADPKPLTAT